MLPQPESDHAMPGDVVIVPSSDFPNMCLVARVKFLDPHDYRNVHLHRISDNHPSPKQATMWARQRLRPLPRIFLDQKLEDQE